MENCTEHKVQVRIEVAVKVIDEDDAISVDHANKAGVEAVENAVRKAFDKGYSKHSFMDTYSVVLVEVDTRPNTLPSIHIPVMVGSGDVKKSSVVAVPPKILSELLATGLHEYITKLDLSGTDVANGTDGKVALLPNGEGAEEEKVADGDEQPEVAQD